MSDQEEAEELRVQGDKRQLSITTDIGSWRCLLLFAMGADNLDDHSRDKALAAMEMLHMKLSMTP